MKYDQDQDNAGVPKFIMEETPRCYFTQIPNIVDDLCLSPYTFRLYVCIRRIAGEKGSCWASAKTLAERCSMSVGQVSKSKHELEDCGLIKIEEVPSPKGKPYHMITIIDVWQINQDWAEGGCSYSEHPQSIKSCDDYLQSHSEIKKNTIKKNPVRAEKTRNLQELLDDPESAEGYWQGTDLPEEVAGKIKSALDKCDCDIDVSIRTDDCIVENNNGHDPSADCEENHSPSETPEEARRRSTREALERGMKKNGGASLEDKLVELYLVSVPQHLIGLARSFCTCVGRPPNRKEDSYWRSEWQTQYELGLTADDIHDGYYKMMNDGLSVKSPASVTCIAENIRRKSKFDMQKTEQGLADKEMEKRAARLRGSQSMVVGRRVFNKDEVMQMDDITWNTALSQAIREDMLDHMEPLDL